MGAQERGGGVWGLRPAVADDILKTYANYIYSNFWAEPDHFIY